MNVRAARMIDGPTKITIELTPDELARLEAIVSGAWGFEAGATDPDSPLRLAAFEVCRQLWPAEAARDGVVFIPGRTGIW